MHVKTLKNLVQPISIVHQKEIGTIELWYANVVLIVWFPSEAPPYSMLATLTHVLNSISLLDILDCVAVSMHYHGNQRGFDWL